MLTTCRYKCEKEVVNVSQKNKCVRHTEETKRHSYQYNWLGSPFIQSNKHFLSYSKTFQVKGPTLLLWVHNRWNLFGEWSICKHRVDFKLLQRNSWSLNPESEWQTPHWSFSVSRWWLGTGQEGHCVLIVLWLAAGGALPAYTCLPGCPQRTVRLQGWTCLLAPRSPSYEGSGAQWGQYGRYRKTQDPQPHMWMQHSTNPP